MSRPKSAPATLYTLRRAQCSIHGFKPCYTICSCVAKFNQPITHVIRPHQAKSGIGEVLCVRRDHEAHEMLLMCALCVSNKGWDKVTEVVP